MKWSAREVGAAHYVRAHRGVSCARILAGAGHWVSWLVLVLGLTATAVLFPAVTSRLRSMPSTATKPGGQPLYGWMTEMKGRKIVLPVKAHNSAPQVFLVGGDGRVASVPQPEQSLEAFLQAGG